MSVKINKNGKEFYIHLGSDSKLYVQMIINNSVNDGRVTVYYR